MGVQPLNSKPGRKISLWNYLDAIKEVEYINASSIRIAIQKAKKLTSEDQKKALPQDWDWTSDSQIGRASCRERV